MEAPEKIYLQENTASYDVEFLPEWFEEREKDSDLEYICKDAFIEKACKWLESLYAPDGSIAPCHVHIIEDFKKYMKEE